MLLRLQEAGCDIVRVAVPDEEAAKALSQIREAIGIPLVADIHFNYRLALMAIERGVDALRINPGNIGKPERVEAVVRAAMEREIPIRIGVPPTEMVTVRTPLSDHASHPSATTQVVKTGNCLNERCESGHLLSKTRPLPRVSIPAR